jgi:hypothetical protein
MIKNASAISVFGRRERTTGRIWTRKRNGKDTWLLANICRDVLG